MIVLFLAFSIPPDWVYLNAKTAQDRHTQRGIEMDNKVLDEAVEVALTAYVNSRGSYEGEVPASSDDIRAALLAGVKVLLGEAVGFVARDSLDELHAGRCSAVMFGTYSDRHGRTIPLYAPSLGEGDGR